MKRLRAFLPLLVLIAIGIALIASGALDRFRPETLAVEQASLKADIAEHPVIAGLAQIGLMTLSISTGIPGAVVLVLAAGMLFGVVKATILCTIGQTMGALILFLASRSAFAHGSGPAPPLVEKLRAVYLAHPFSFTLFLRLVPFFPFGGVTVALAWLRCPLWLFTLCTVIGGTVMLIFESALGAGLAETVAREGKVSLNILGEPRVFLPMLGMAALALVPVILSQLRRKPGTPPPPL